MNIVIIGGGITGLKAASRARRRDPELKITIIERKNYISLAKCGLPFYIGGLVHEIDNLRETTYGVVGDEKFFRKVKNIDVLTSTEVTDIDPKRRVVKISTKHSDDELNYDYLVIATGSTPIRLNVCEDNSDRILYPHLPEDTNKLIEFWEEGAERAVVVGSRLIGLEMCEALSNLEFNVTLIESADQIAPKILDFDVAKLVELHLLEKNINVMLSSNIKDIKERKDELVVQTTRGDLITDIIVIAAEVRPNIEIARKAGLQIGMTGAIKVNKRMQTSEKYIFSGGDCVENYHLITNKEVYFPFCNVASKHGRIIGDNIAGGNSEFPGILGTIIFKVFNFTVARTGLNEFEAINNGFNPTSVIVPCPDRSHYYPGTSYIRMKITFDCNSRKLLGAQIVGSGIIDKRIDVLATAIYSGLTIDQVANLDLGHSPPFSAPLDSVITAANVAKNKLDGLLETIKADELRKMLQEDDVIIIDLRSEDETRLKKIDHRSYINIPITELREKITGIPRDKKIVLVCQLGLRSYEASRILKGMGFKHVKILEGGLAFWN